MTIGERVGLLITNRQSEVEAVLTDALHLLAYEASKTWPVYEREQSLKQLLLLSRGGDCNYDRPTLGLAYACWYHAQRTSDGLVSLASALCDSDDAEVELLDLGSGTGATWWAVLLIENARRELGLAPRRIRIRAVDSSPTMNEVASVLWDAARAAWPTADVEVDLQLASWLDRPPRIDGGMATLSYVFDHSDATKAAEVGVVLARTLNACGANVVSVLGPSTKGALMDEAIRGLVDGGAWSTADVRTIPNPFKGTIGSLSAVRRLLLHGSTDTRLARLGATSPTWASRATSSTVLERRGGGQLVLDVAKPGRIMFDPAQEFAAAPHRAMTAVLGAAGSGKSRVLVERLVRTVETARPADDLHILVTSFNTLLIDQLQDWFGEADPDGLLEVQAQDFGEGIFKGGSWTVEFLNWDKVPPRLFDVTMDAPSEDEAVFAQLWPFLADEVRSTAADRGWDQRFVADEYRRVFYGLEALTKKQYLAVTRRGRGAALQASDRECLFQIMTDPRRVRGWTDPRVDALVSMRSGYQSPKYDFVFIDECQDYLPADFSIAASLVHDRSGLVVFGDSAQGLHVGSSHWLPTSRDRRWTYHRLRGSYRLPMRICEAVLPLGRQLLASRKHGDSDVADDDIMVPEAVKSATLGIRPVVLDGNSPSVESDLKTIVDYYGGLIDTQRQPSGPFATIPESDHRLKSAMQVAWPGKSIEEASMRKIKGLERPLVVWPTRALIPTASTLGEWVYTILTRTTCVVVIILSSDTDEAVRAVVSRLDRSRLLFWNQQAEDVFDSWAQTVDSSIDPLAC